MNKQYRIMQFEQIINNIQTAIDIADEIEVEDVKDRLESLLSGLENIYDEFALNVLDDEVKNEDWNNTKR